MPTNGCYSEEEYYNALQQAQLECDGLDGLSATQIINAILLRNDYCIAEPCSLDSFSCRPPQTIGIRFNETNRLNYYFWQRPNVREALTNPPAIPLVNFNPLRANAFPSNKPGFCATYIGFGFTFDAVGARWNVGFELQFGLSPSTIPGGIKLEFVGTLLVISNAGVVGQPSDYKILTQNYPGFSGDQFTFPDWINEGNGLHFPMSSWPSLVPGTDVYTMGQSGFTSSIEVPQNVFCGQNSILLNQVACVSSSLNITSNYQLFYKKCPLGVEVPNIGPLDPPPPTPS